MVLEKHMCNFMRQHTRQFGFILECVNQALGDKNIPPRCRKGVVATVIQNHKGPWQVGTCGLQADPAAQAVDIGLQRHVFVQGLGAQQHRSQVLADFNFTWLINLFHGLREQAQQIGVVGLGCCSRWCRAAAQVQQFAQGVLVVGWS